MYNFRHRCKIRHYNHKFLLCFIYDRQESFFHLKGCRSDCFVVHTETICIRCVQIPFQFIEKDLYIGLAIQFQHIVLIHSAGTVSASFFVFNIDTAKDEHAIIKDIILGVVVFLTVYV